ncbi:MAG TPA: DUF4231 domain-containing protein [Burkholderiales bacterium]|nr:DUF4231 domain-containing protein [Burkholderiales bacterium]
MLPQLKRVVTDLLGLQLHAAWIGAMIAAARVPQPGRRMMTEQEYLEQRLDRQVAWYDGRAASNQRWYRGLRVLEVILASSIPLFSSLVQGNPSMGILVSVISVSIAILAGLLGLYKFQENWIEYRATAEALKHEKFMFLTRSGPYNVEQPLPILVERVEGTIAKEGTAWSGTMRQPVARGGRDEEAAAPR